MSTDPALATPATHPGLLVLPGWDDDGRHQYDALRAALAPSGWQCRRADLPDASWPAVRRDTVDRAENLRQVVVDHAALSARSGSGPIAALGFSYGGYMAALLTGLERVDWLVLRAPALYPDEDWNVPKAELDKGQLDDYRQRLHSPAHNRALQCLSAFRGDVLLVQCECDEVIAPPVYESYAMALGQSRSLTRHLLRGADHELSQERHQREYHDLVVAWLTQRAR